MGSKRTYWYVGHVTSFGKIIDRKWTGSTKATSEAEARRNLTYQYKISHKLLPKAKIELPGKLY